MTQERTGRLLTGAFGRIWTPFALASTGDGFTYGAVPLLAVVVDPRPIAVASVVAADGLPWLLVALPAGALADRFERSRVMAGASLIRALVLGLLAVLVAFHGIDLELLILVVLCNAGCRAIFYAAMQATVPELLGSEQLDRANGVLTSTEAATEHLGGPIGGSAVFVLARAVPFLASMASFALAGVALLRVRTRVPDRAAETGSIWDGVRCLASDRRLRLLLGLVAGLAGLQGLVSGVLVLVATRDWGVHASAYGLFLAAGAAGNLPGALLADRFVRWFGSAMTLMLAAAIAGGSYLLMAAAHGWELAGAGFLISGFAIGTGVVASNALRQRLAPPEIMGRVGAAWRGIAWGAAPTGALVAGGVAILGGLRLPLVVAGAAQCLLALAIGPALVRTMRSAAPPEVEELVVDGAALEPAPGGDSGGS